MSSDGKKVAPVARSYDGNEWETSAGNFTSISIVCESQSCSLVLPSLIENEEYKVEILDYTLSRKDEIARFLEQSTFGTTLDDLNSFDANVPTDNAIGNWIKDQMENKDISLHRSWFRTRIAHHFSYSQSIARPYHFCEKNTRYRSYAFSSKDNNRMIFVTEMGTKFLLSIGNEVRTLVNSINWLSSSYKNSHGNMPTDNVGYKICREPEDFVNGRIWVEDNGGSCVEISVNGQAGGNPAVSFDSNTFTPPHVELTSSDARSFNDLYFKGTDAQNLILTQDLTKPPCINVTEELNVYHYHALYLPTNKWFIHTPPPILLENTLDSPAVDGGGKNKAFTKGLTRCANAPRTFLNEESCSMSYEEIVCSSLGSTQSTPVMVCGSPGEIANDPFVEGPKAISTFDVATRLRRTTGDPEFVVYVSIHYNFLQSNHLFYRDLFVIEFK